MGKAGILFFESHHLLLDEAAQSQESNNNLERDKYKQKLFGASSMLERHL